jgi:hypothetical protein
MPMTPRSAALLSRRRQLLRTVATLSLVGALGGCLAPAQQPLLQPVARARQGDAYVREELYFGLARDSGQVSESEWSTFLTEYVTPRFPSGLTVVRARGQYRMESGTIIGEDTQVLILLYERDLARLKERETAIQEIISEYKRRFAQESVLRVQAVVGVTF